MQPDALTKSVVEPVGHFMQEGMNNYIQNNPDSAANVVSLLQSGDASLRFVMDMSPLNMRVIFVPADTTLEPTLLFSYEPIPEQFSH